MKTTRTLLVTGALSAIVLWASAANAESPLTITDLSGPVQIQQAVPCGNPVTRTLQIEQGLMEISSPVSTPDGIFFNLFRLDMFLTPFSVERNCFGVPVVANFSEIGVSLAGAVRFRAEPTGGLDARLYRFVIPKEQFLVYESILDNNPVPQPEKTYQRPSEDVTGLISLQPRPRIVGIDDAPSRGFVQLHLVFAQQMRFRGGCALGHCLINETDGGTTTSDLLATNDGATPPTVACTPVRTPGGGFQVSASDESLTPPTIKLGSFTLGNNEVIQLQQTGQPGVRLVETTRSPGIRHFQVGPGENFIVAIGADTHLAAVAYCQ